MHLYTNEIRPIKLIDDGEQIIRYAHAPSKLIVIMNYGTDEIVPYAKQLIR